jgi:hypothetical protein
MGQWGVDFDPLELAWAAGFYDGEGSTITQIEPSAGRVTLQVCVSQCDRRPLDRFQAALGGIGKIYGPMPRPNPRHSALYQYRINRFEHSQAAIAAMWKFLCEPKRQQAAAAVRKFHTNRSDSTPMRLRQACRGGHPPTDWVVSSEGRIRCRECRRALYYRRLGRPMPARTGKGRPMDRSRSWLTSPPSSGVAASP